MRPRTVGVGVFLIAFGVGMLFFSYDIENNPFGAVIFSFFEDRAEAMLFGFVIQIIGFVDLATGLGMTVYGIVKQE